MAGSLQLFDEKPKQALFSCLPPKTCSWKSSALGPSRIYFLAQLLVNTVGTLYKADNMKSWIRWQKLELIPKDANMSTSHIVRETSCTVPCFQRDVAVEEPVVLHAARVLTAAGTLGGSGAVCGCRTGVAPRSVVAPV